MSSLSSLGRNVHMLTFQILTGKKNELVLLKIASLNIILGIQEFGHDTYSLIAFLECFWCLNSPPRQPCWTKILECYSN